MSGQTSIPDYRETLFEYPDLTKIHGESTYESLRLIQNQLKADARSVHSSLGGGQLGHLGLVLTPAQYALLSPHPYIRPPRPPPLVLPAYQLPHVVQTAQNRHNDQIKLLNECNNVEQALHQQIIKAVENAFLTALRNRLTNTIDVAIPVIFDYLFTNHGCVSPAMLQTEEAVKEMYYDITHPIDVIFNKIEDLNDLSIAARADYTEQQLINIAYVIINNTAKYQHYIHDWTRLPLVQKTWRNFKTHFRRAHQELKETGDLQVRETTFNSANLVQEVIDGVQLALHPPDATPSDDSPQIIQQFANNATQAQLMPQLMAQMVQMMEQMSTIQQKLSAQQSVSSSNTTLSSNCSRRRRTRGTIDSYCWSHGACAHSSSQCQSKKAGHQDNATLVNKLGGSTAFCVPGST